MSAKIEIVAGRTKTLLWSGKIVGVDGITQEAMAAGDHIRFKLAVTAGGTPVLDLNSKTPSTNGSGVTIDNRGGASVRASGTIVLAQNDTSALAGTYFYELIFVDASAAASKQDIELDRGQVTFLVQQSGSLGVPP
jgi:hypothetical protein